MKLRMIIFSICMMSLVLTAQTNLGKAEGDKPTFTRENTGEELTKPVITELPSTSTLSKEEDKAWQMIFDALEKDGSDDLSSSRPPSDLNSSEHEENDSEHRGKSNSGKGRGRNSGRGPDHRPPGWDKGDKEGWDGGNVPPGLRKDHAGRGRGRK